MARDAEMKAIDLAEAALDRLREADALLESLNVGPCSIHLDACIAVLESCIARARSSEQSLRGRRFDDALR